MRGIVRLPRRGCPALILAALVCLLPGLPATAGDLASWPMFNQGPRHTSRSRIVAAQTATLRWIHTYGTTPYPVAVPISPATDPDQTIYFGGLENFLYALNADGTRKWRVKLAGDLSGYSPAVGQDGTIYLGSGQFDAHGWLNAVNPDGTLKWRLQTAEPMLLPPTIGRDGTIYVSGDERFLYAVNPDGSLKWRVETGGASGWFGSPAIARDGTIYIGTPGGCAPEPPICQDGYFNALNPDGTVKWRYPTGPTGASAPAVTWSGTIYFGTNNYLYALNPNGSLKWRYRLPATGTYSAPAIGWDGTIYITAGGSVYAVRPNGTLRWHYEVGGGLFAGLAISGDNTIYFGSDNSNVYALDPDGTLKWRYDTGSSVNSSPAIGADGTVYIGCGTFVGRTELHSVCAFGPGPGQATITLQDPEGIESEE